MLKVMKDKEWLKNYHTLGQSKEVWQLNAMWIPRTDPETETEISWKIGEICIKITNLVNSTVAMLSF